jgi:hypothetical protein
MASDRSAYLAENPLGKAAHATFAFFGDDLQPDEVTSRLEITPDLARTKGQTIPSRGGAITQPTGVWLIESQAAIQSTSLERHLDYLLRRIEPRNSDVIAICNEFGAEVGFNCFWVPAGFHGGPMLSASILGRISLLEAGLWFDIYADLRDEAED